MRVLYLCNDPGIDLARQSGGAIHIRSFVHALNELGHEVTIVACSAPGSRPSLEADLRATVLPAQLAGWNRSLAHALRVANRALGRAPRRSPDAVRALHNLTFFKAALHAARQFNPDFIYERYSLWAMAGLFLARKLSIPLALEVNSPLAYEQQHYRSGLTCPPLARGVEGAIWRKADLIIAVSESLRSHMLRAGVKSERVHVLPNAVNGRLFHGDLDGTAVRERFNLKDRFVVGFVGSFKRWHGVDLLLAVFRDLHEKDASSHLLLVGDGPLRLQYEEEVRKAGITQAVTFAGAVSHQHVPGYLAAMDVAVAPYPALEDFYYSPMKLFEYMAAGRAVVASRIGQAGEILIDGDTGLLYEPGDRAGLVDRIQRFWRDAGLRQEMGRRASAACSTRTWRQNAARLISWVEPEIQQFRGGGREHKAPA